VSAKISVVPTSNPEAPGDRWLDRVPQAFRSEVQGIARQIARSRKLEPSDISVLVRIGEALESIRIARVFADAAAKQHMLEDWSTAMTKITTGETLVRGFFRDLGLVRVASRAQVRNSERSGADWTGIL